MTARNLPATDIHRLGSIAGMLGSDHDGERAAAAFQATKLLQQHGWTWRDVINRAFSTKPARPKPATGSGSIPPWRIQVDLCLSHEHRLTPWEVQFCRSLALRRNPPTVKQVAILRELYERVRRA